MKKKIITTVLLSAPTLLNAAEFPRLDEALPSLIDILAQVLFSIGMVMAAIPLRYKP